MHYVSGCLKNKTLTYFIEKTSFLGAVHLTCILTLTKLLLNKHLWYDKQDRSTQAVGCAKILQLLSPYTLHTMKRSAEL